MIRLPFVVACAVACSAVTSFAHADEARARANAPGDGIGGIQENRELNGPAPVSQFAGARGRNEDTFSSYTLFDGSAQATNNWGNGVLTASGFHAWLADDVSDLSQLSGFRTVTWYAGARTIDDITISWAEGSGMSGDIDFTIKRYANFTSPSVWEGMVADFDFDMEVIGRSFALTSDQRDPDATFSSRNRWRMNQNGLVNRSFADSSLSAPITESLDLTILDGQTITIDISADLDLRSGFGPGTQAADTIAASFGIWLELPEGAVIASESGYDYTVASVPAPGAAALFGAAGLLAARRRRSC